MKKFKAYLALTRYQETIEVSIILTLISFVVAKGAVDWRFLLLLLANSLTYIYAFMINDVEDAPEDATDAKKGKRNPIANGSLTSQEGYIAATFVALVAFLIYLILSILSQNLVVIASGIVLLVTSFFYSYRAVRLKKIPLVDLISHCYMLAAGYFMTTFYTYNQEMGLIPFTVLLFLTLFSIRGELTNEILDYDIDLRTNIKTTAVFLGKRVAKILQALFTILPLLIGIYLLFNIRIPWGNLLINILIVCLLLIIPIINYRHDKKFAVLLRHIEKTIVTITNINLLLYILGLRFYL